MTVGLKTLAYADSVMALLDAQRRGADEAIFLDTDGHCSEATASNLFIYRDGTLLTPPVTCAALPGITRATVLELARATGIAAVEQSFGTADLSSAGEAFLTSSLRGIAPVAVVDGQRIGSTMPGTVTRQLTAAYHALVEQECGGR
jgi:branched-subunit amino acid aminotransferase/4-amino-4-deoxychorismate lyase